MQREMDKIIFENKDEVWEVMKMADTFIEEHPEAKNSETLQRFLGLMDMMEMEW